MSSRPTTEIKTIDFIVRHNSSANGNPCFRLYFTDDTSAVTQTDAMVAYAIANPEFRGVPVEFTFTRAGRVSYARPVEPMSHGYALGYLDALGYLEAAVDGFLEGRRSRAKLAAELAFVRNGVRLHLDQVAPR